jgi:hypothetical protein
MVLVYFLVKQEINFLYSAYVYHYFKSLFIQISNLISLINSVGYMITIGQLPESIGFGFI